MTLWHELRYGLRALRRDRGATVLAVLSLALGIGANAAIFGIADAYLLRAWQVRQPEDLVFVRARSADGRRTGSFPRAIVDRLRDAGQTGPLSPLAAFDGSTATVTIDGQAEVIYADFVSGDYFPMLGVQPALGRLLTPDDDRPGRPAVVVIGHAYWMTRFGGNPNVIGTRVTFKEFVCTIVGVTGPEFFGRRTAGNGPAITLPLVLHSSLALRDHLDLEMLGRLRPGVTADAARAHLDAMYQQAFAGQKSAGQAASSPPPARIELQSAQRGGADLGALSRQLTILQIVAGLVLLIAAVNVASLQLARGSARQHEWAVRLALGASRGRVMRQALIESIAVSCAGGLLGVIVATSSADLLLALIRGDANAYSSALRSLNPLHWLTVTRAADVATAPAMSMGGVTLAFTAALVPIAAIVCGLIPALRLTRVHPASAVAATASASLRTRGAARGPRAGWSLVVLQVALSIVLLIPAGLLVRSVDRLSRVDLGFNADRLLVFWIFPTLSGYDGPREMALYAQLIDRVNAMPGVEAASFSRYSILRRGRERGLTIHAPDRKVDASASFVLDAAAPRFFDTIGLRLLAGRDFAATDTSSSAPVAVINETMAQRYFSAGSAIGHRIEIDGTPRTIIGIVSAMRFDLRDVESTPAAYIPYTQAPPDMLGQMLIKVRTRASDPLSIVPDVRREIRAMAPSLAPVSIATASRDIANTASAEASLATLVSAAGVLALFLAMVGLYGTTMQMVTRRTSEIGVRAVLGARPRDVAQMVLRQVAALVAIGVLIGVPCAFGVARIVASFLFGVGAADVTTIAWCVAIVVTVAAIAGALPARRAARIDPLIALRAE